MSSRRTWLPQVLSRSPFARGVATIAGGSVGGQVALLAVSPLLTRLYGPEAFGLLAVYMSLTAIAAVVLSLRYEVAIPLPDDVEEALRVATVAVLAVLLTSTLTLLVVVLARHRIADAFGTPALAEALWLLPVSNLLLGLFRVARSWAVRSGAYGAIALSRLKQVGASIAVQLACAPLGAIGLVLGQIANQSAGTWSLVREPARQLAPRRGEILTATGLAATARRYARFPLISTWGALLNAGSLQMPPLLIAATFGPAAAGFYALANRVLKSPAGTIGGALNNVFLSRAARAARDGTLGQLTSRLHAELSLLALAPLATLALLAPDLFALGFGESWRPAGEFGRWLTLVAYAAVVGSPLTMLFTVLERQRLELRFQMLLFAMRLGGLALGAWLGGALLAVALFSVASLLWTAALLVWVGRIVGDAGRLWMQCSVAVGAAALVSAPVVVARSMDDSLAATAFGLAATVALYGALVAARARALARLRTDHPVTKGLGG